jgi:hypothetical protein
MLYAQTFYRGDTYTIKSIDTDMLGNYVYLRYIFINDDEDKQPFGPAMALETLLQPELSTLKPVLGTYVRCLIKIVFYFVR